MTTHIGSKLYSLENSRTCPFLGLADDEQTALAFPSDWNNCHHCSPVHSVKLDHQRLYCLNQNYKNCLAYIQPSDKTMPHEMRNRYPMRTNEGNWNWQIALTMVLLVFVVIPGLVFADQVGSFFKASFPESLAQPSIASTLAPISMTSTPALQFSPTPIAPSSMATSTQISVFFSDGPVLATSVAAQATPTITRVPRDIEALIGINYVFKIHRVKHGEKLELLAHANGTTAAAVFAVNYHLTTPLKVQQVIILPVNQIDVSDLPPFEPYRVIEDTSLDDLATALNSNAGQIQFYNGLGTSTQLYQGEWVIVPRDGEQVE